MHSLDINIVPYVLAIGFLVWLISIMAVTRWSKLRFLLPLQMLVAAVIIVYIAVVTFPDGRSRPLTHWSDMLTGFHLDLDAEFQVGASRLIPGVGIFLLIHADGVIEPIHIRLPWDGEMAQQLASALEEGEEGSGGVLMRMPFEHSLDIRRPQFYNMPQPALPPKPVEPVDPVQRFFGQGRDA